MASTQPITMNDIKTGSKIRTPQLLAGYRPTVIKVHTRTSAGAFVKLVKKVCVCVRTYVHVVAVERQSRPMIDLDRSHFDSIRQGRYTHQPFLHELSNVREKSLFQGMEKKSMEGALCNRGKFQLLHSMQQRRLPSPSRSA